MKGSHQIKTIFLTAIAPIVWGSTYIVTTELLPPDKPLLASTIRALPAGLFLVLISRTLPDGKWLRRLALLGFLNIGLFFLLFILCGNLFTRWNSINSNVYSTNDCTPTKLGGAEVQTTTASVLCLCLWGGSIFLLVINSAVKVNLLGVAVAFIGTLSMASGVVLTKKWVRPERMTLLSFTGWQLLFGGLMLLPMALWVEGVPNHLNFSNYVGYLYLSLIGSILGYSLWFRGIEKLPPITVSFLGFLSSVSACILGYLILDQTLTLLQLMGVLFVLISIYLAAPHKEISHHKVNYLRT